MPRVNHIIIGDAHSRPDVSNERFRLLGQFIADAATTLEDEVFKVIDMGDFADYRSLSHYDKGKLSGEGKRLKADMDDEFIARQLVTNPYQQEQASRIRNKKKRLTNVEFIALGGNHFEQRLQRLQNDNPALYEALPKPQDLAVGWRYVPFLQPSLEDGIAYVHYWQARGSSQPMGTGKYPAQVLIREKHTSTVVGHSHVLDVATQTTADGKRLFALAAGCFLDPNQYEEYAKQSNTEWWRGIVILNDVRDGYPHGGWNMIPIERLFEEYGG